MGDDTSQPGTAEFHATSQTGAPSDTLEAVPKNPLRLREAWRALKVLLSDPDRTDQVFVIINALSGNSGEKQFLRFRKTTTGQRVLAEEENILESLVDHQHLNALPQGSLGETYAQFMQAEKISADGLVTASIEGGGTPHPDPNRARFRQRLRDTHDLWHVATGYNRDLVGEAALLAFTFAQTRNPGIGVIIAMGYYRLGQVPGARKMIRNAYRRGRKASWLPAADWKALLPVPVSEIRTELNLGEPETYSELRSEAGAMALKS